MIDLRAMLLADLEHFVIRHRACSQLTGEATGPGGERLLYDLIRPRQQRRRNRQADRLGGLEVDDELEFGRPLDW